MAAEVLSRILSLVGPQDYAHLRRMFAESPEMVTKSDLYTSRFRIGFTRSGTTPNFTYTLPSTVRLKPFQYGLSDVPTAAGFPSNYGAATLLDTNIQTRGETNDGEINVITGVGVALDPAADPVLARVALWNSMLSLGFGSQEFGYKLGALIHWPGGGGVFGGGLSPFVLPAAGEPRANVPGAVSNGWPVGQNFRRLTEAIVWYPKGSPRPDQNFQATISVPRAVSFPATARDAGTGIAAVTIPDTGEAGSYIDGVLILEGLQLQPRSTQRG